VTNASTYTFSVTFVRRRGVVLFANLLCPLSPRGTFTFRRFIIRTPTNFLNAWISFFILYKPQWFCNVFELHNVNNKTPDNIASDYLMNATKTSGYVTLLFAGRFRICQRRETPASFVFVSNSSEIIFSKSSHTRTQTFSTTRASSCDVIFSSDLFIYFLLFFSFFKVYVQVSYL